MKTLLTIFTVAFLAMGMNTATAQTKVCHINMQELIEAMPAYQNAKNEISSLETTYDTEIRGMVTELQNLAQRYDSEAPNQIEAENNRRIEEVQQKQERIAEYRQNALKDLREKETTLLTQITESAVNAVQKIARAKGFDYVVDSTPGSGILLADGYDILADVKRELGI